MWGEALFCSVYVLNRLPTDSLKCTPYKIWEKQKPNIKLCKYLEVMHLLKRLDPLKKLEERSKRLYFVGYAPNGYRLWNPKEKKIIIARDVRFQETSLTENENTNIRKVKFFQSNENSEEGRILSEEEDS